MVTGLWEQITAGFWGDILWETPGVAPSKMGRTWMKPWFWRWARAGFAPWAMLPLVMTVDCFKGKIFWGGMFLLILAFNF